MKISEYNRMADLPVYVLFVIGAVIQFINLRNAPRIFIDENLYVSRAWSFIYYGKIDIIPLSYDYDHPFLGWLIIGLIFPLIPVADYYTKGRIVICAMAVIRGYFLLRISRITVRFDMAENRGVFRSATGRRYYLYVYFISSVLPIMFYLYTPCIISLNRMVLIDNIATTFVMAAIYYSVYSRKDTIGKYLPYFLIGIAALVKYTYFLFLPSVFLTYLLFFPDKIGLSPNRSESNISHKFTLHALVEFIKGASVSFAIFLIWPIYAVINGELVYSESWGLLPKIIAQIMRGDYIPFWRNDSYFIRSISYFTSVNPWVFFPPVFFPLISVVYMISNFFIKKRKGDAIYSPTSGTKDNNIPRYYRNLRAILTYLPSGVSISFIWAIFYTLLLIRGGYVYFFYFIPIFAVTSLGLQGITSVFIIKRRIIRRNQHFRSPKSGRRPFVISVIVTLLFMTVYFPFSYSVLYRDENIAIDNMKEYVLNNLPKDAVYVTDGYYLPFFIEHGYRAYFLYWRCNSYDPVFNAEYLKGDWRNIDYFIIDNSTYDILTSGPYIEENVTYYALLHAVPVAEFGDPYSDYVITVYRVIKE